MCQIGLIYDATTVSEDNWSLNAASNTVGIIGMGPSSPLWEPYINSTLGTATYSISLARTDNPVITTRNLKAFGASTTTDSVITMGYADSSSYVNQASLTISSDSSFAYTLSSFSLGVVYLDKYSIPQAQYWSPLDKAYPVTMSTSFAGLGLPTPVYLAVVNLLVELEADLICSDSISGYCYIQETCASYFKEFNNYSFLMQFSSNSGTYMRVPLRTFAEDVIISDIPSCQLMIVNLDVSLVNANSIVLGGMFF
jgi:hypothetical protein